MIDDDAAAAAEWTKKLPVLALTTVEATSAAKASAPFKMTFQKGLLSVPWYTCPPSVQSNYSSPH